MLKIGSDLCKDFKLIDTNESFNLFSVKGLKNSSDSLKRKLLSFKLGRDDGEESNEWK